MKKVFLSSFPYFSLEFNAMCARTAIDTKIDIPANATIDPNGNIPILSPLFISFFEFICSFNRIYSVVSP